MTALRVGVCLGCTLAVVLGLAPWWVALLGALFAFGLIVLLELVLAVRRIRPRRR